MMSEDSSIGPARKLQLAKNAALNAVDEYFQSNWPMDTEEKYARLLELEAFAGAESTKFFEFIRPKGPKVN